MSVIHFRRCHSKTRYQLLGSLGAAIVLKIGVAQAKGQRNLKNLLKSAIVMRLIIRPIMMKNKNKEKWKEILCESMGQGSRITLAFRHFCSTSLLSSHSLLASRCLSTTGSTDLVFTRITFHSRRRLHSVTWASQAPNAPRSRSIFSGARQISHYLSSVSVQPTSKT